MSQSNSKGMFERAKDRWNCALIYMTEDLGRCGINVFRVGSYLLMHTNRSQFYRHEHLVAFPSLERLAYMLRLNEKTVRRALERLVSLGLITIQHRFENSNLYYLDIPVAAEEHSRVCQDLLSNPRHRTARNQADNKANQQTLNDAQMSGRLDNYARRHAVNVQGPTDRLSDLHSISKSHLSGGNEKRLGEEEGRKQSPSDSPSEMALNFRDARKIGELSASIVGAAVNKWGRSADEIRAAIDTVREMDGDAGDLAHELYQPEDYI
jgi:hypothetical protein